MIYSDITKLIGNTPLLKVPQPVHHLKNIDLYIKLELFNPWGSIKDRTSLAMVEGYENDMRSGKKLLELSSGNTAKALQLLASMNGTSLKTITNRIKIPEQRDILNFLGASIEELPGKSDCYDPSDPNDPMIIINQELQAHLDEYIFTNQYSNPKNRYIHSNTTGDEIAKDLPNVDYFIAGLGTTGSSGGIIERLKKDNANVKAIGVVAKSGDYVPGIRTNDELLEVGLFSRSDYEEILSYSSSTAIEGMLTLAKRLGVLAGPTTGATFMGSLEYLEKIDKTATSRKTAVLVACDRMEWYLSYIKERRPDLFGGRVIEHWRDSAAATTEQCTINAEDAQQWIAQTKPLVIDTRSAFAFNMGHIVNSVNFPYDQIDGLLNAATPFEKHRPLLFVCAVGEKSLAIARYLQSKQYAAYSLGLGITAWRDADLPLVKESNNE